MARADQSLSAIKALGSVRTIDQQRESPARRCVSRARSSTRCASGPLCLNFQPETRAQTDDLAHLQLSWRNWAAAIRKPSFTHEIDHQLLPGSTSDALQAMDANALGHNNLEPADRCRCAVASDDGDSMRQNQILGCYVTVYVLAWTGLTFLANTSVPGGDAIEAFNWAANLDWGTPRSGWLVGLAMYPALLFKSIAARSFYWYFAHFLGVGVGMVGVWKLALRLTTSTHLAWLAVLALHLSMAISTDAQNQNDNYLLIMLWPWLFYFFIRAGFDNSRFWLPFAVIAGLATMAKYSTLAFVWSIFVLTLISPSLRRTYRQPWIYVAIALFFLIVAPNIIWLWHHDFVAIHWFSDDAQKGFAPSTILAVIITFINVWVLLLLLWLVGIKFRWPSSQAARSAIICMLLPLAIIVAYLVFYPPRNTSRVSEWLRPFSILGPPLFVACISDMPSSVFRRIFASLAGIGCIIFFGYAAAKSANFRNSYYRGSGAALVGAKAQELWRLRYNSPLYYVAGGDIAKATTFYASDFPALLQSWSNSEQPNIFTRDLRAAEVRQRGTLLIGSPGVPCAEADFSSTVKAWPDMHIDELKEIAFTDAPFAPVQLLCLAFVAPQP